VVVPRPQQRDVIDAVQERNHNRIADQRRRRQLESRLQLRCLRRHPQDVNFSVEQGRSRNVDLEITERSALDTEPARMSRKRLSPEQEHDVCLGASECTADETADAARAENRVSHANDRKPP
jgi:hypothetical protein